MKNQTGWLIFILMGFLFALACGWTDRITGEEPPPEAVTREVEQPVIWRIEKTPALAEAPAIPPPQRIAQPVSVVAEPTEQVVAAPPQAVDPPPEQSTEVIEQKVPDPSQTADQPLEQDVEAAEPETVETPPDRIETEMMGVIEKPPDAIETIVELETTPVPTNTVAPIKNPVEEETEKTALNAKGVQATLQDFASYRWQFRLEFEGLDTEAQVTRGYVDMFIEAIREPAAMHMRLDAEGQPVQDLGGTARSEIYTVEETAYMQDSEDGSWFSFPANKDQAAFFADGLFNPDDILSLPPQARRNPQPEMVNNLATWHYTFDAADLSDPTFTLEQATGDVWVSQEGGYPIKLILTATGVDTGSENRLFTTGTLKMTYELRDINANFTIDLPEEARQAAGFDDLLTMPDATETGLPIMAGADVEFSTPDFTRYTTKAAVSEIVDFYRTTLPEQGWIADPASDVISEMSALMKFSKDGTELGLVLSKGDTEVVNVILTIQ